MQIGLMIMTRGPGGTGAGLAAMAKAAESGGLDYLGVNDHVVAPAAIDSTYPYSKEGKWAGAATGECLETVSVVSFIAAATERVRILTSVLVAPHRPPLLAAKMLSTADILSNGRLTVGIGAGWMREEFEALGAPPYDERGKVTDEYIQVFRKVWTEERPSFDGTYTRFAPILFEPKPVQDPCPPVRIGGESPAALRRTVRLGDGWCPASHNPRHLLDTPERYGDGLARLRQVSEQAGRNPAEIHHGLFATRPLDPEARIRNGVRDLFTGSTAEIAGDLCAYRDQGVQTMICSIISPDLNQVLERIDWLARDIAPMVRG